MAETRTVLSPRKDYDDACKRADEKMKANNGHSFEHILKTRCVYCGRSPRAKGKCRGWFMTFINLLYYELDDSAGFPFGPPMLYSSEHKTAASLRGEAADAR